MTNAGKYCSASAVVLFIAIESSAKLKIWPIIRKPNRLGGSLALSKGNPNDDKNQYRTEAAAT
jgi:hypothetical protein